LWAVRGRGGAVIQRPTLTNEDRHRQAKALFRAPLQAPEQVGGGRVGLYAGFCGRGALRHCPDRRPSISACRCRQAPAAYPQASGGPPLAPAQAEPLDPTLLGLAPGGVCRAIPVTRDAGGLLPRRFTLTGVLAHPGGLFSVALSRGSPRVAVSNHPALWSPDVPRRWANPPTRPPGRLVRRATNATPEPGRRLTGHDAGRANTRRDAGRLNR